MTLAAVGWQVCQASIASACSPAPPGSYDHEAGSSNPPPALHIDDIEITLGDNYGEPGPGDCSDLGRVRIWLSTDDGEPLDGRFGVKVNVVRGHIPVVKTTLDDFVAETENNSVRLTIASRDPVVDFTVTVQAVNASDELGAESPEVSGHAEAGAGGACSIGRTRSAGGLFYPAAIAAAAGMLGFRRRIRRASPT